MFNLSFLRSNDINYRSATAPLIKFINKKVEIAISEASIVVPWYSSSCSSKIEERFSKSIFSYWQNFIRYANQQVLLESSFKWNEFTKPELLMIFPVIKCNFLPHLGRRLISRKDIVVQCV